MSRGLLTRKQRDMVVSLQLLNAERSPCLIQADLGATEDVPDASATDTAPVKSALVPGVRDWGTPNPSITE